MVSYKELYEVLKEKEEAHKEHIKNLETNRVLETAKIELERLKLLKSENCLGLNEGEFVYVIYWRHTLRGKKKFSQLGFISKETLNHIRILVYDKTRESAYKYHIHKETILGIKQYDGDNESIISYEDLLKIWEDSKK